MNHIYALTIEQIIGPLVWDLFSDVQKLKKQFPQVTIKLEHRGVVVDAGIYETREQMANSIYGVIEGDKQKIIDNLPSIGHATTIGAALELMNDQIKAEGYDGFSEEQLDTIVNKYADVEKRTGRKDNYRIAELRPEDELEDNIYALTIEQLPGPLVWDMFDDVQELKRQFPKAMIKLEHRGVVVDAGIYDTREQMANSIYGVIEGDRERIIHNLPIEGKRTEIGAAIELMSNQMKDRGYEGFTDDEIDTIQNNYPLPEKISENRR